MEGAAGESERVGAASLNGPKYFLPWNPMKIGDPMGFRFIKMYQNFQTKKMTRRSPYWQ